MTQIDTDDCAEEPLSRAGFNNAAPKLYGDAMDMWHARAIDMSTRYPAHSAISNQWLCVARQVERARASIRKLKAELQRGNHD